MNWITHIAQDADGRVFGYSDEPYMVTGAWGTRGEVHGTLIYTPKSEGTNLDLLLDIEVDWGTKDWREMMVKRPECKHSEIVIKSIGPEHYKWKMNRGEFTQRIVQVMRGGKVVHEAHFTGPRAKKESLAFASNISSGTSDYTKE